MIQIKKYSSKDITGKDTFLTIASGPVIIKDNKVLLDKHGDDNFWKFPGGRLHESESPIEAAKREVREELSIEINIISVPFIINFTRETEGKTEYVILFHYLSELKSNNVKPDRDVRDWEWFDVNKLPEDLAPNIKPTLDYFGK